MRRGGAASGNLQILGELDEMLLFIAGFEHGSKNTDSKVQEMCEGQQCLNDSSPGIHWVSAAGLKFCVVARWLHPCPCYLPLILIKKSVLQNPVPARVSQ